jgi:hypothetical protein
MDVKNCIYALGKITGFAIARKKGRATPPRRGMDQRPIGWLPLPRTRGSPMLHVRVPFYELIFTRPVHLQRPIEQIHMNDKGEDDR